MIHGEREPRQVLGKMARHCGLFSAPGMDIRRKEGQRVARPAMPMLNSTTEW